MIRTSFLSIAAIAAGALLATGCATLPPPVAHNAPPSIPAATASRTALAVLPAPNRKVAIAVYSFMDQTGQYKPSETGQTLSRAVTQGGASILVKTLRDTGNGAWFTVVERERLDNLLRERQIISEMRARYLGEREVNPEALPAMLFAGVILEGGIIGYDSNTLTGGAGAALLGIGASAQYRQDTVTVYLRAVSVRSGEVLASVTANKTIMSQAISATAFRYVGYKELLETEAGYTTNEPDQIALEQAIQKAVFALVMEGVEQKIWEFGDFNAGWPALYRYRQERDGVLTAKEVQAMVEAERKGAPAKVITPAPPEAPRASTTANTRQAALTPAQQSAQVRMAANATK